MVPPTIYQHFFLLLLAIFTMRATAQLPIRLLTHNIRYATSVPFAGEKPWSDRRPLIINELRYNTLYNAESFVCLQEVLHEQLVDVMNGLNEGGEGEEWAYIGVGRDDGKEDGEYSPIIYRQGVWGLETWETVWLSETPDVPGSKGWDAASVRIVTVGTFVHKQSKMKVVGMCTHFDNAGQKSRSESAKLILEVMANVTNPDNSTSTLPVFLGGDLNSETSGEAYQILNGEDSALQDVQELATWSYGEENTYTGFTELTPKTEIDFVFVNRANGGEAEWQVKGHSVLSNVFEDGVYSSDHRAVVADTVLSG